MSRLSPSAKQVVICIGMVSRSGRSRALFYAVGTNFKNTRRTKTLRSWMKQSKTRMRQYVTHIFLYTFTIIVNYLQITFPNDFLTYKSESLKESFRTV